MASVEIRTVNNHITMILPPGQVHLQDFGNFNPTLGVESKAIRITSDVELQIVVYKSNSWFSDAHKVPSVPSNSSIYFTTAYMGDGTIGGCSSSSEKEFYLVTFFYDDTFISVIQQDGVTYEAQLRSYGTFIQTTTSPSNHIASGTMISSSKPINVISGNLCIQNNAGYGVTGTCALNIPTVESLGKVYVLPRIISSDFLETGFSVSVVATTDNTTVESDGEVQFLNQGQTEIFDYPFLNRSIIVNCSEQCLVAQYSKSQGRSRKYGLFMLPTLPDREFSTYFSSLEVHQSRLSLVVLGESPGDDLFLNGESLGYLNWTAINGYSTAEMTIAEDTYELESENGRPFATYIYSHAHLIVVQATHYCLQNHPGACLVDWREIFMKQFAGKCKQINF